jgi:hypothetical protein
LLKLSVSRVALCSADLLSKNQLAAQLRSGLLLFHPIYSLILETHALI